VKGQEVSERTIEKLSGEVMKIDPQPDLRVQCVSVPGQDREVQYIEVSGGREKPYRYEGQAYRRVGNTTVVLPSHKQNWLVLETQHENERWENQLAEGWAIEDLDEDRIQAVVSMSVSKERLTDPGERDVVNLLNRLELLKDGAPLLAAAVLFGKSRRLAVRMPKCMLQVARIPDTEPLEFLDNRQFYGNAFELLEAASGYLQRTLPIAGRFDGGIRRIDIPAYPPQAVREAMANALCHRDYSNLSGGGIQMGVYDDRLEISSPGPLHFGLTPEHLHDPHRSRPWNPLIAKTFYRCGIIESWGIGVSQMVKLTESAGQPRPQITDSDLDVTVCFWAGPAQQPQEAEQRGSVALRRNELSASQRAVLDHLEHAEHPLSRQEISAKFKSKISDRNLRTILYMLKKQGLATTTGRGRYILWKRTQN